MRSAISKPPPPRPIFIRTQDLVQISLESTEGWKIQDVGEWIFRIIHSRLQVPLPSTSYNSPLWRRSWQISTTSPNPRHIPTSVLAGPPLEFFYNNQNRERGARLKKSKLGLEKLVTEDARDRKCKKEAMKTRCIGTVVSTTNETREQSLGRDRVYCTRIRRLTLIFLQRK